MVYQHGEGALAPLPPSLPPSPYTALSVLPASPCPPRLPVCLSPNTLLTFQYGPSFFMESNYWTSVMLSLKFLPTFSMSWTSSVPNALDSYSPGCTTLKPDALLGPLELFLTMLSSWSRFFSGTLVVLHVQQLCVGFGDCLRGCFGGGLSVIPGLTQIHANL